MKQWYKKITASLLSALLMTALLAGCAGGESGSDESGADTDGGEITAAVDRVNYSGWDTGDAVRITLNGTSIQVDGDGATADGSVLTITQGGVYVLSGTLDDGQILVEAGKEDEVWLVLDGVELSCSDSAPIYSAKAGLTVLILADGTGNTVTDGATYTYPDDATDEPDAAIFCKDDLTITGGGSLTVYGNFNNGIGSKDDLIIDGGTITVEAANHGIRGRDSLTVLDGQLKIRSGNDGLQSNNDGGEGQGWILIEGGAFDITSDHDAIQAETSLTISGGAFTILAGGGVAATSNLEDSESYKALKAGGDLTVSGGTFSIDSADDALHANGNLTISAGTFAIATGDDGVHADGDLLITGGTIDISTSYEGLEGSTVTVTDGMVRLRASDDGINAAGGTDSGGEGGRFGGDRFRADDNLYIDISGGTVIVEASGDGIDSNGNVFMSGGVLVVHGPTSGGDAPLDFDGAFTISGGVLAAAGSSGMAQAPGSDSTQASLMVYFSSVQEAGATLHLADENGEPLLSLTPEKNYQSVVLSSPALEVGGRYTLYTGGTASGDDIGGLIIGGTYSGGTQVVQATLSGITTRISDTGEPPSGAPGGMGGGRPNGGTPPDGDFQPPGDRTGGPPS